MIHGNSSCKEVFRNQYDGAIGRDYRCIAMDLPGHGASDDAADPERTYWMPGYAEAAMQVMEHLDIPAYAVLGWSLGGHIGLEMIGRTDAVTRLMISGTPPFEMTKDSVDRAFRDTPHMHLAGQRDFSAQDVTDYARSTCGENAPQEAFLHEAVARTDGRARERMIDRITDAAAVDQRRAAAKANIPLAIVNGEEDAFIDNDYIAAISYDNLWEGQVHRMVGIGHAPFWEVPELFDPILRRFLG
ncbi:alpha/beta hydrolase [Pseudoroseicyclus sp. CLL3-39]|uniref:Alpha/beta hydrolase n=2 Tax=Pseudoroseicyclus tamaricis TaxID=2705421 RepID=A0A6B2JX79_9RHOB|nr:alpha/beta hydrolase [Pseudoroseicyclus tamaricis]